VCYQRRTMPRLEFTIADAMQGRRLDKVVIDALGHRLGRSGAKELFAAGAVRVAGKRVSKGDVALSGQVVTVELPEEVGERPAAEADAPRDVRLERDDLVGVCKPAGQPTAPLRPGEQGTLAGALLGHYPEMDGVGRTPREPGILHRLDTGTSGLVLAARTADAFQAALAALHAGEIRKRYLLVCAAEGLAETGEIDIPLAPHPKDHRRVLACAHERDQHRNNPRPASTKYRLVKVVGDLALVEASASKAQRHQIRAHFAAIGHPLEGDALYGGSTERIGRQALHASYLAWSGTASIVGFEVEAALPEDLRALIEAAERG